MAGAHINATIDDQALRAAFAQLESAATDLEPFWRDVGEYLTLAHDERFARGESPDGVKWEPLKPVTLAKKTRNLDKILVETGHLRETLRYQIQGDTLLFGTNVIYGATHQFGAKEGQFGRYSQIGRVKKYGLGSFKGSAGTKKGFPIPWGDIPARPFLGVSNDDHQPILSILERHLRRSIR